MPLAWTVAWTVLWAPQTSQASRSWSALGMSNGARFQATHALVSAVWSKSSARAWSCVSRYAVRSSGPRACGDELVEGRTGGRVHAISRGDDVAHAHHYPAG